MASRRQVASSRRRLALHGADESSALRSGRPLPISAMGETVMRDAPNNIWLKKADGILEVTWSDEEPRRFRIRQLRCACACAGCVDEMSGVRTLDVNTVREDIAITDMQLVGNYAVKFVFSDGHNTGIYSWDRLYEMKNAT